MAFCEVNDRFARMIAFENKTQAERRCCFDFITKVINAVLGLLTLFLHRKLGVVTKLNLIWDDGHQIELSAVAPLKL